MKIYLAANETVHSYMLKLQEDIFVGANILNSFYRATEDVIKKNISDCSEYMLDSGAFSFLNGQKKGVDWDEYIERYADVVRRQNIEKFFELDIDSVVGYEKVLYFRTKLEKLTNKQSIPVWHKSRGYAEYLRACESYSYVAIGGIVTGEYSTQMIRAFQQFIRDAHKRRAKVHGLGFTRPNLLKEIHFDSVDSSSWLATGYHGRVCHFRENKFEAPKRLPGHRIRDLHEVYVHNFNQWKKYCDWAETHL